MPPLPSSLPSHAAAQSAATAAWRAALAAAAASGDGATSPRRAVRNGRGSTPNLAPKRARSAYPAHAANECRTTAAAQATLREAVPGPYCTEFQGSRGAVGHGRGVGRGGAVGAAPPTPPQQALPSASPAHPATRPTQQRHPPFPLFLFSLVPGGCRPNSRRPQ